MHNTYDTDLLIVGAGPVGLFTSYQAGYLEIPHIVVDPLEKVGGQLVELYPEKYIYDVAGYPKVLAEDLITQLKQQADQYPKQYLLSRTVDDLKQSGGRFTVTTSSHDVISCKVIIIAAGAGAFGPNKPPIKDIETYENKSLFYSVKIPKQFANQTVLIAGGGDSAIDWAIGLYDLAKKIYVVHRRDKFRCSPSSMSKLHELAALDDKLELMIPYVLDELKGVNGSISQVVLKNIQTGDLKEIGVDSCLAFYGLIRSLGGLQKWGLSIDSVRNTIIVDKSNYATNIEGIYAVGDIAQYENKLKLITLGFGEAAIAVHDAWKFIFPDKVFHFVHSTSKKK